MSPPVADHLRLCLGESFSKSYEQEKLWFNLQVFYIPECALDLGQHQECQTCKALSTEPSAKETGCERPSF